MTRLFIVSMLSFFIAFQGFSQSRSVSGKVADAKTLKALSNAEVVDQSSGTGVTTSINGTFLISVDSQKDVEITISFVGYETLIKILKAGKLYDNISILLEPKAEQLQEVEIMGVTLQNKAYRTEDVNIEMLESSNLQDVGYLLRQMPNVNGIRKGAMGIDPVIRGFKYSQLNVQLNGGTRIEGGCPNRMDPATAHVDLSDVKEIKVLKGPFALKYGVNFGGMIDMTTYRPVFYEKYQTNVNAMIGGQTNHTGFKMVTGCPVHWSNRHTPVTWVLKSQTNMFFTRVPIFLREPMLTFLLCQWTKEKMTRRCLA